MSAPFNLIWSQNGSIIHGYQNGAYIEGSLVFPVSFPGNITSVQQVTLQSSAQANGTLDILSGVSFYLTGDSDDLQTVLSKWPNLGNAYNPPRPEMNGGLQVSFDGSDWITFVSPGSANITAAAALGASSLSVDDASALCPSGQLTVNGQTLTYTGISGSTITGVAGIVQPLPVDAVVEQLTSGASVGDPSNPSSWLGLPAIAIGTGASDGVLGPYDTATLYLRYVIPGTADEYQVFNIQLAVDCDIV